MATPAGGEYRLYRDLAGWWPLISPPEEYAEEAAALAEVLGSAPLAVRNVLDLGSGGGHIAVHLKRQFALTLVDLSGEMLSVSRMLNPGCDHHQGDMRTVRLGRQFDAVLVHDAVDYMTTEADLRQVIETAFAHCRPGGVAVFVPDHVAETFQAVSGEGGGDDASGRQARFRERTWDPDPADTWVQSDYEFTLRDPDGAVEVVKESHRLGMFARATWLRLLTNAGFIPLTDAGFTPLTEAGFTPLTRAGCTPLTDAGFTADPPPVAAPRNLFTARRPAEQPAAPSPPPAGPAPSAPPPSV